MALDFDPNQSIDPNAYSFEASASEFISNHIDNNQVPLKNNFGVSAELQQTAPPPDQDYGQQIVTGQVHGEEFLTQCENAEMLQQIEMNVSGMGAELFGAACEGISSMTTEVSAEFLQPITVAATPLEPETPTNVYNQSLTI